MKSIFSLTILTLFLSVSHLMGDDTYVLKYSHENNCTLSKNSISVPTFDPKFKREQPKTSYTCQAIQKEKYNECHIVKKENVTALVFAYGPYEYTNLLIAIKSPTKHIKSEIEVVCTKSLLH